VIIALRTPGAVFSIDTFQSGKDFEAPAREFGPEKFFDDLRIDTGGGFKVDDDPEFGGETSSTRGLEPVAIFGATVSVDQYDGTSTVLGGKGPLDFMFGSPISLPRVKPLFSSTRSNAISVMKAR